MLIFRRIEERGSITTAHFVRNICSSIFRYAIVTGRAERDPAGDLKGAITPYVAKHMAAITDPNKVGKLLVAINQYRGTLSTRCGLLFMALTFCRVTEIRMAEWDEFDFENSLWRIPARKMKMDRDHLVPLSKQALNVLEMIRPHTEGKRYVFPGGQLGKEFLSVMAFVEALRIMGFGKDEMTAHGFRAMASTLLNEQGFPADVIERQLAHAPRNRIRGIYNRAEYLPERRAMMQSWADYLGSLHEKALEELGNV